MTNKLLKISVFFFNDTATTEIYTLSLHDALPISTLSSKILASHKDHFAKLCVDAILRLKGGTDLRSEEHTSELQSRSDLVCRLLLEKKNKNNTCHLVPQLS